MPKNELEVFSEQAVRWRQRKALEPIGELNKMLAVELRPVSKTTVAPPIEIPAKDLLPEHLLRPLVPKAGLSCCWRMRRQSAANKNARSGRAVFSRLFSRLIGGQGQNRTADTGIFRACKINNLLIILEQAVFGTVSENNADSIG